MAENGDRLWPTDKEVAGLSNENRNATIQNSINTYKDNVIKLIDAESEELHKVKMANGLFDQSDMTSNIYNNYFYPLPRIDPYNMVEGTREIVFFTRPNIPIYGIGDSNPMPNYARSSYLKYLYSSGYTHILDILAGRKSKNNIITPFMNILTNRITSNLDIPDINVDSLETAQNMWGTKILYPKSSLSSDEGSSITCEFEDTKYLEIYHLFKAWDHFRQGKWMGMFDIDINDILCKILYDHIAVYKFIIANDGETILYWCKWTGMFPESISRSAFSEIPKNGPLKINIGFKCSGWFNELKPDIITEFNNLVTSFYNIRPNTNDVWDICNPDLNYSADQTEVLCPYIVKPELAANFSNKDIQQPLFEWIKKR